MSSHARYLHASKERERERPAGGSLLPITESMRVWTGEGRLLPPPSFLLGQYRDSVPTTSPPPSSHSPPSDSLSPIDSLSVNGTREREGVGEGFISHTYVLAVSLPPPLLRSLSSILPSILFQSVSNPSLVFIPFQSRVPAFHLLLFAPLSRVFFSFRVPSISLLPPISWPEYLDCFE